jgi:Fur family transcriptional regulator, ferric uptake regulator
MSPTKSAKREASPAVAQARTLAESQALLRERGLKSTASRIAVLRHLEAARAPTSHGEVSTALEPLGFDRATLYRNLIDLTEAGLVSKSDFGDHVFRFELRDGKTEHASEHPHFVCTDCGTVSCLPEVRVKISAPPSSASVVGQGVAVQLKGRCANCA